MKKIFAILILMLTFSISANAQSAQADPYQAALNDVAALKKVVKIEAGSDRVFESIFYDKHKFLLQDNLTQEEKQEKFRHTEERLATALQPAQLEKLKANTELYRKLTN